MKLCVEHLGFTFWPILYNRAPMKRVFIGYSFTIITNVCIIQKAIHA